MSSVTATNQEDYEKQFECSYISAVIQSMNWLACLLLFGVILGQQRKPKPKPLQ